MIVERVQSSLEMTSPDQLQPSPHVAGVALRPWSGPIGQLQDVHDEIGAPHRWPSVDWSEQAWLSRLADASVRWFAIEVDGDVAGLLEIEAQADQVVEITIFGLRPAFQGLGLGGIALTLAVQAAWTEFAPTRRIWLHTSTRDGPRALTNYQRRGFTVFTTVIKTEDIRG